MLLAEARNAQPSSLIDSIGSQLERKHVGMQTSALEDAITLPSNGAMICLVSFCPWFHAKRTGVNAVSLRS